MLEKWNLWPKANAKRTPKVPDIKKRIANIYIGGEYWTNTFAEVNALDHITTKAKPSSMAFKSRFFSLNLKGLDRTIYRAV